MHGSFHTHPSQRQRPGEVTVCEGAGHARDLGRAGADGLGGIAPRSGDNRDFFDDGAYLRQRECKKSRCNLQEVDVRRQHPRLEIGRDWIEVIGGRERPTCLATAEEAMVAQMIVDIGNEHVEGDAPIEGMSVRLPRSEERRGGKEGVSTCRSRWWKYH